MVGQEKSLLTIYSFGEHLYPPGAVNMHLFVWNLFMHHIQVFIQFSFIHFAVRLNSRTGEKGTGAVRALYQSTTVCKNLSAVPVLLLVFFLLIFKDFDTFKLDFQNPRTFKHSQGLYKPCS